MKVGPQRLSNVVHRQTNEQTNKSETSFFGGGKTFFYSIGPLETTRIEALQ